MYEPELLHNFLSRNHFEILATPFDNMAYSVEPERKAAYSPDLRWRTVWQMIGMNLPFRDIARNVNVSVGTVHKTFTTFLSTGDIMIQKENREVTCSGIFRGGGAFGARATP